MADYITSLTQSPLFAVLIVAGILIAVAYRLGFRYSKGIKTVSREEQIRKKLIKMLKKNKNKTAILKQKGNILGITSNYGSADIDGHEEVAFYYKPKLIGNIPAFWSEDTLVIDRKLITETKEPLIKGTKNLIPVLILPENYMRFTYFGIGCNFADKQALSFIRMIEKADKDEVRSSVQLAQDLRLTNVDFTKPFTTETPKAIERRYEETTKTGG